MQLGAGTNVESPWDLSLTLRLQSVEAALFQGQLRPLEPLGHVELDHVGSQVCCW